MMGQFLKMCFSLAGQNSCPGNKLKKRGKFQFFQEKNPSCPALTTACGSLSLSLSLSLFLALGLAFAAGRAARNPDGTGLA